MTMVPDDCFVSTARAVSFDAARRSALAFANPLGRVEEVPLAAARGRLLARSVFAPRALPPFDQAAMDGYAVRLAGREGVPLVLPIVGRTDAGDPPAALQPGTAHRIMTGAPLSSGADTVIMQEHVNRRGDLLQVAPDVAPNRNIRRAGEDIAEGALVLRSGREIGWPEIALLAALGVATVPVAAPVRIAILTTGSELRHAGGEVSAGGIYDSNSPMLAALLAGPNTAITSLTIEDDLDALTGALQEQSRSADLLITTGGMASGDRDYVRGAIERAGGRLDIVKVAMKPGKPVALGRVGGALFVGLPGNPQAAAFAALAFVRPMVAGLAGMSLAPPIMAVLSFPPHRKAGCTELVPVRLAREGNHLVAYRSGPEGSHRMMPMVDANAVAVVSGAGAPAASGMLVEVLPFDRLYRER